MQQLKAQLAEPASVPQVSPPADATLAQLQQLMAPVRKECDDAKKLSDEKAGEQLRRADRRTKIRDELAKFKSQLDETSKQLAKPPHPDDPRTRARGARCVQP